mmetsp:Transcript_8082/g.16753  ORF Transcript_8082/g.16753 Transcript_8082/m.16753 type:complete len:447 (-) Transcript_8082:138-1478(-)
MDQVGQGSEVVSELAGGAAGRSTPLVFVPQKTHDPWRSVVPVLANQSVDGIVFPEFPNARCQDDQLPAVGDRQSRPVDRLVAEPRRVELVGIEVDDHRFGGFFQHGKIHGHAQLAGSLVALDGVADKDAPQAAVGGDHRQDVPQIQVVLEEFLACVIEDRPQRVVGPAHHFFHPVDGTDKVRQVDRLEAPDANEQVLVEVCHSHDLVGDDLSDGDHQGVRPGAASVARFLFSFFPNGLVELCRPRLVDHPVGGGFDHLVGNVTDGRHVVPPVVDHERVVVAAVTIVVVVVQLAELVPVHLFDLFPRHRCVGSQGGHDLEFRGGRERRRSSSSSIFVTAITRDALVVFGNHPRDFPRLRMETGVVGWQQKDVLSGAEPIEEGIQGIPEGLVVDGSVLVVLGFVSDNGADQRRGRAGRSLCRCVGIGHGGVVRVLRMVRLGVGVSVGR